MMELIAWWASNYGWVLATLGLIQFMFLTWLGVTGHNYNKSLL